jgi:rubredoxin
MCDRLQLREIGYHPDPEINEEIVADALAGEIADVAAGYPPKFWRCPDCGRGHKRGHFLTVGIHRCMGCGYMWTGGTIHTHGADGRLVA